jgi:gliding motility-associated-like protein
MASNYVITTNTAFETYQWQDGSSDSIYVPQGSGSFFVSVTDFNGCESFDEMSLELADCTLDLPNIFTPNGDGQNDTWRIITELPDYFNLVVYNRWGRKVYESIEVGSYWDGSHYKSGEDCSDGVYYYILQVRDFEGANRGQTGYVMLIR